MAKRKPARTKNKYESDIDSIIAIFRSIPEERFIEGRFQEYRNGVLHGSPVGLLDNKDDGRKISNLFLSFGLNILGVSEGREKGFEAGTPKKRVMKALQNMKLLVTKLPDRVSFNYESDISFLK